MSEPNWVQSKKQRIGHSASSRLYSGARGQQNQQFKLHVHVCNILQQGSFIFFYTNISLFKQNF